MILALSSSDKYVASLAEAWIEINRWTARIRPSRSPPSRRRGLKYCKHCNALICADVASLAEAWIEIDLIYPRALLKSVASLAEAWIEITMAIIVSE